MIELAPGLTLPESAVTNSYALLAMKGAGKSNAAVVFAEQLFAAHIPWVCIDPKGDWWGIRSGAGGHGKGLPVPIFGGVHADVPIDPQAGKLFAELVVDQHLTCLIDTSELTKGESIRFLTAFFDHLYRRKNRSTYPMHLFLEEADDYVPQKVYGEVAALVRTVELVVKRGRQRGLGITLASQRAASINKDALTQTDTLIVLRTTSPQDRKQIKDWLDYHAGAADIVDELPTLGDGEAWVSSPAQLRILKKVKFRRRSTFDSGATPELGDKVRAATLADIDIKAITAAVGDLVEKAKADDPKLLRSEIARLKKELDQAKRARVDEPEQIEVEVVHEVLPADLADTLEVVIREAGPRVLDGLVEELRSALAQVAETTPPPAKRAERAQPAQPTMRRNPSRRSTPDPSTNGTRDLPLGDLGLANLGRMERAILTVLAQHPDGRTNTQLTTLTGYRYSGGFKNALSALRTAGLITGGNTATMRITEAGDDALGDWEPLPSGPALLDWWMANQLSGMERPIVKKLIEFHPAALTGTELADATGYQYSGGFKNALSKLRTLTIAEGGNTSGVRLTDDFAEAIA